MDIQAQLAVAVQHQEAGRLADAELIYRKILETTPTEVRALHLLGLLYRRSGRLREALAADQQAVGLQPNVPLLHNALGETLRALARPDDAANAFRRAISLDPKFVAAHFNLGILLGEVEKPNRSVDVKMALTGRIKLRPPKDIVFSCFDEQNIISGLVSCLPDIVRYCVDLGASDGVTLSNSYPLFRDGWSGLAVEPDLAKVSELAFALKDFESRISVAACHVTPDNLAPMFKTYEVPRDFGFLTLDIDSYDYDVADELLRMYNPRVICVEINERIPPPIKYALRYRRGQALPEVGSIFGGVSIAMMHELFDRFGYVVVGLEYNNLFAVRRVDLRSYSGKYCEMSPHDAWRKGYFDRSDRRIKLPWNEAYDYIAALPVEKQLAEISRLIAPVRQHFDLSL